MKLKLKTQQLADILRNIKSFFLESDMSLCTKLLKLEVKGKQLILTYNNMVQSVKASIPVEEGEDGSIIVLASLFTKVASNIVGEETTMAKTKSQLVIRSGKSFSKVNTIPEKDFVDFHEVERTLVCEAKLEDLKQLIKHTIFAVSKDLAKEVFTSICVKIKEDGCTFASTDGIMLATSFSPNIKSTIPAEMLVPAATLDMLKNINSNVTFKISAAQGLIFFESDNMKIASRLISGTFINYEDVIPKDYVQEVVLKSGEVHRAIDAVIAYGINAFLELENGDLVIASKPTSAGTTKQYITPVSKSVKKEEEIKVLVGINLLESFVDAYSGDVIIRFVGNTSPVVIQSGNSKGVVMPLRGH